jgi:hypothetical protein
MVGYTSAPRAFSGWNRIDWIGRGPAPWLSPGGNGLFPVRVQRDLDKRRGGVADTRRRLEINGDGPEILVSAGFMTPLFYVRSP